MSKILDRQPESPNEAFDRAVVSLKTQLSDPTATMKTLANAFVRVLDILEMIPIATPIYTGTRAVLIANFRAIGHEFLDGRDGMAIRQGAAKDIDLHARKVLANSWL